MRSKITPEFPVLAKGQIESSWGGKIISSLCVPLSWRRVDHVGGAVQGSVLGQKGGRAGLEEELDMSVS